MAHIQLKNVFKIYQGAQEPSVTDFNIDIQSGEFIVFVGPSGCGKSTTLRMIAGLEDISKGELSINKKIVNNTPPKDRDIAMVFQNYALYPHMSVYDNMAFGLKLRKYPKDEIDKLVTEAAKTLGLENYLDRKPKALSGGQRQRVALGRAIVRIPKVFLMDEPLSNLDAKLRVQMRAEIIKLHQRLKATTIYVTHDQTEAMTMADRIVVMKDGFVQQIGAPKELYNNPANKFVGEFIGSPSMNFLTGIYKDGQFHIGDTTLKLTEAKAKLLNERGYEGKELYMGARPEHLHDELVMLNSYPEARVTLKIDVYELLGAETILYSSLHQQPLTARIDARTEVNVGEEITLAFDMNKVLFFDKTTENRIN
ncbi:sugar ABC transporter ATP-binding protein [Priestia megaterium]|nr:sugar ABC transporter ATP-binding protein [Priestia megaterium]